MKGLPDRIQVGPVTYRVSTDPHEVTRVQAEEQDKELSGYHDGDTQLIVLDGGQGDDSLAVALVHETLHALMYVTGVGRLLDDKTEERVVDGLDAALVDLLRRNPALVRVLTS